MAEEECEVAEEAWLAFPLALQEASVVVVETAEG